jgi:hypothetical protein
LKPLVKNFEQHGLIQATLEPCLFVGPKVIALCYVDAILFYAHGNADIDALIANIKTDEIMIRHEGSNKGFLGVDIKPIGLP